MDSLERIAQGGDNANDWFITLPCIQISISRRCRVCDAVYETSLTITCEETAEAISSLSPAGEFERFVQREQIVIVPTRLRIKRKYA